VISEKLKIMDWLVHGGHQYEFFKTGHDFFCTHVSGARPYPKELNRPDNKNVTYLEEVVARKKVFDIIMIRAGVNPKRYEAFRQRSPGDLPGIAVIQTHTPFKVPEWARCCVWNAKVSMDRYRHMFPKQKHFYIPHGFDPNEFNFLDLERNNRVLSGVNVFEERAHLLGYNEWRWVANNFKRCDLIGHGNDKISESIGNHDLKGLVENYNKYSVFLNTTTKSAMPRTRAEALMCGTPLITTKNFGIENYLTHGKNCLYADTKEDMLRQIKRLMASEDMQGNIGLAGREAAIKFFNIKEYKARWEEVFSYAVK
jgi:glycosyltransferase involved in cell wall biosynthesis